MKTYNITAAEEPQNHGVRIIIHGLEHPYSSHPKPNTDWLFTRYTHEKNVPPFFCEGIAESRCYTLPWAVYIWLYDECQTNEQLHDGDEMVLDYDGRKYVTVVGTWPTCDAAQFFEDAFRVEHGLPTLAEAERARQDRSEAERRCAGGW